MSNFENISCKVLGVILFVLIVILSLQLTSCASNTSKKQILSLLDNSGNEHKYKVDISRLNLSNNNQYCRTHYQWESIMVFRHLKDGSMETWYRVTPQ